MLIYTSYFAQVKNLPSDIVPISIAAKQVPGWRYPVYKALAPTYNILYDYKRDGDKDHYVAAYLRDVLRYLSQERLSLIWRSCQAARILHLFATRSQVRFVTDTLWQDG